MIKENEIKKDFSLSTEELQQFRDNGFIGPFKLYEQEEMAEKLKKLRYSLLDRTNAAYKMDDAVSTINNISNYDRHLDIPFLNEHVKNPIIVDKLKGMFGENILCWRSEWFPKYPGDKGTIWHQVDTFEFSNGEPLLVWPEKADFGGTLTVWTALTDTTVETACMKFMPGTHNELYFDEKIGIKYNPTIANDGFFGYDFRSLQKDPDWVPDESKAVSVEMKAGEFIIFWSTLMHSSNPHLGKTDQMRLAYVSRYVPDYVDVYPGNPEVLKEFGGEISLKKYKTVEVAGTNRNPNNRI